MEVNSFQMLLIDVTFYLLFSVYQWITRMGVGPQGHQTPCSKISVVTKQGCSISTGGPCLCDVYMVYDNTLHNLPYIYVATLQN